MYFGHNLILTSPGSQVLIFAAEGDGSGLQRLSCPGPMAVTLPLKIRPYLEEERSLVLVTPCWAVTKRVERRHVGKSGLAMLWRRRVALDLFTFWEPLWPLEDNFVSLEWYPSCPVLLASHLEKPHWRREWQMLRGIRCRWGPHPGDGTWGHLPQRTVALATSHEHFEFLLVDGTQCMIGIEQMNEAKMVAHWSLVLGSRSKQKQKYAVLVHFIEGTKKIISWEISKIVY